MLEMYSALDVNGTERVFAIDSNSPNYRRDMSLFKSELKGLTKLGTVDPNTGARLDTKRSTDTVDYLKGELLGRPRTDVDGKPLSDTEQARLDHEEYMAEHPTEGVLRIDANGHAANHFSRAKEVAPKKVETREDTKESEGLDINDRGFASNHFSRK